MAKKGKSVYKANTETALRRKYKGTGLAEEVLTDNELRIPSRFLALNHQLGGGAYYGKIHEIFGEESSGKSLTALDFAYVTQKLGGVVLWADSEYAFTKDWSLQNGLNLDKIELFREKAIEVISDWSVDMAIYYRSKLVNNEPILLVVDSIAALSCLANLGGYQQDEKAEMGNRAKAIDAWLRNRNGIYEELGITVILINQLRKKIGASQFEDPDTTPGGMATRFYASIRVGFYGGKQITAKVNGVEERVGRITSIRIKKNKVAPPKPTIKGAEVYFHPGYKEPIGFNRYFNLPELLNQQGVISRKKGSSKYMMGDELVANGELVFLKKLKNDADFRKMLIEKTDINTISKTRSKLKSISYNMFPVNLGKDKEEDEEQE